MCPWPPGRVSISSIAGRTRQSRRDLLAGRNRGFWMSVQPSLPPVEEYPGYFTGKPPFMKRRKVQVVSAGIAGLLIGTMMGSGGSASSSPAADAVPEDQVQARIGEAVDQAVSDAVDEARASEQDGTEQRLDEAAAAVDETMAELRVTERQLKRARAETRRVRVAARASQRRAVAAAVSRTKTQMRQQAPVVRSRASAGVGVGGGSDPQFAYCYEANDAGYGNYQQGVDPEYGWYEDSDNDGWVCEF